MTQAADRQVPAEHFATAEGQRHAARLGLWVFLASELLLFSGLFALYAGYRAHAPEVFREAVHSNTKVLGSINTAVLLASSAFVAAAVHALRGGRRRASTLFVGLTAMLGVVFLVIKLVEYRKHFAEGIFPGHVAGAHGHAIEYWTLYFVTTGLHAIHVTIGIVVLVTLALVVRRDRTEPPIAYRLELGAVYWHLVDVIWIFLWPLYYLA